MKRDYIITSSARTMLKKGGNDIIYHLIFVTDQTQIQELNKLINHAVLSGYHAYKIAEEPEPGKDLLFTSKILVEMQFPVKEDALLVRAMLLEKGLAPQLMDDQRALGKEVAFVKGDRFSNSAF